MNRGVALVALICLTGCAVGPDYRRPPLSADAGYPVPDMEGGELALRSGDPPSARWWEAFGSPALNALVDQAQRQSPTVLAAKARLKAAEEDLRAEKGQLWPSLLVGQDQTRQSYSSVPGTPGTFYNVTTRSVSVSYVFDLFGGERRAIEGKVAQRDYARFEQAAASQALTANVVTTAVEVACLDDQISALRDMVADQRETLTLTNTQLAAGSVGLANRLGAQSEFDRLQTDLAGLVRRQAEARHRLSILLGQSPAQDAGQDLHLADLTLQRDVPVSMPSLLVEQRPDLRASEALLRQANADVGVAEAGMFPNISLNGNFASTVWYATNSVWQPVFHGGSLGARKKSAEASHEAADARYRSTALGAFQNVADVLSALDSDNRAYASAKDRLVNAETRRALMEERLAAGSVSRLSLIGERQAWQQARSDVARAKGALIADTTALFLALGGNW